MNGFKIDIDEIPDNYVFQCERKVITQIIKDQDEATYKAILRYCEENNVVPNIISEDKLKIVLRLGIAELNKRDLESRKIIMKYKEFKKWCNERACDGCWSLKQAQFCIDVIKYINAHWFWQREKIWKQEYEYLTYLQVIKPINDILESKGE